MAKLNSAIFMLAILLTFVGCVNRNTLPAQITPTPALANDPIQTAIDEPALNLSLEDVNYRVAPLYDYDITGLVVSYRHHDGNRSLHKRWNDHLNMMDLCVVWGGTANSGILNRLKFWNGAFTCNIKTYDQDAWSQFDMTELSNNHLLSVDRTIRRAVQSVRVGDQIRIKGRLSEYSANGGPVRGTSITREDGGNGACETIYVDEFEIVADSPAGWRALMKFGLLLMLISTVVHILAPFQR